MTRYHYDVIQEKHIAQIESWIAEDIDRWDDPDQTFREYCDDYSDRFAIAALKASDLGYPDHLVKQMIDELRSFESWFAR